MVYICKYSLLNNTLNFNQKGGRGYYSNDAITSDHYHQSCPGFIPSFPLFYSRVKENYSEASRTTGGDSYQQSK